MSSYILGIDLGTTSVKVSVVDVEKNEILDHFTEETNCEIPIDIEGAHEQFVPKIIQTLNSCVSHLKPNLCEKTTKIGVCGQMHGVLFWNSTEETKPWKFHDQKYIIDETRVSRLYTWQDARCDKDFLATLPTPESHLGASTGFGIPTIFWLKRNKPEYLQKYNRSGLMSSFVVAMLCDQLPAYTSYQNAASWGYFNCLEYQWNLKLLETADFPTNLLPELRPSGEVVGTLTQNWYGIPAGATVGVDLGDLQCSVISTLGSQQDAVINFSTSTQIAFVVDDYIPTSGPPDFLPPSYWPYFKKQFVGVAASLNGGNVLVFFVKMLESWMSELLVPLEDEPWEKLIDLGSQKSADSNLKVIPQCLGERFDPDALASVLNISGSNLSLGQVFKALCRGLIENLHNMLPAEKLRDAKITRIVGNGLGLYKNQILKDEVERLFQLPLVFEHVGDACKGAAIAMYRYNDVSAEAV